MSSSKETSITHLLDALRHLTSTREGDADNWLSIISRLQFTISSHEESRKEVLRKKSGGIELLLLSLECGGELSVLLAVTRLISDLASRTKGASALGRRGAVGVLMRTLAWSFKTYPSEDRLINPLMHLLVALAPKEKQFPVKARLFGILPIPIAVMKHGTHRSALLPALQLVKLCSSKGLNATVLGKKGAVGILVKVLKESTKSDARFLKKILEALIAVTSSRDNAAKLVSLGGVKLAMEMFSDYHRDRDSHHVALSNQYLLVVKNCSAVRAGREAFLSCGGMKLLYDTCMLALSVKLLKPLLKTALFVLKRCLPRRPLPVKSVAHPVAFTVPSRDATVDGGEVVATVEASSSWNDAESDDDVDEKDNKSEDQPTPDAEEGSSTGTWQLPLDLSHYSTFFAELELDSTTSAGDDLSLVDLSDTTEIAKSACEGWFCKIPAPQVYGHNARQGLVALRRKTNAATERMMFVKDAERYVHPEELINRVVFDLEKPKSLSSDDDDLKDALLFESRFECGNLRKAIQVRSSEYDLVLNADINSQRHHQWFYFEVSNFNSDIPYRFNIINCEKPNSQFNFGMQPVLYSTQAAQKGSPGWIRRGTNVCYYRNNYLRSSDGKEKDESKPTYYTLTFTVVFPRAKDTCYLAYHFPYSYSKLLSHLLHLQRLSSTSSDVVFRRQLLCYTLSGNKCDLLTITAAGDITDRQYIFLSSRVHPGESNASWAMEGVLDFLLSSHPEAASLLQKFIFKIIPMLNPDGVINGSHRCSLLGKDLNRQWIDPDSVLHPAIFHSKALLQYLLAVEKPPLVFCDFHGHSRRKNAFIFGCNPNKEVEVIEHLPSILSHLAPLFSYKRCSFTVEKSKEGTGRVVVWRQMGVPRSYTMEHTYCGADQGPYKGYQVDTNQLKEMGQYFCMALIHLVDQSDPALLQAAVEDHQKDTTKETDSIPSDTSVNDSKGNAQKESSESDSAEIENDKKSEANSSEDETHTT
eukprot:m.83416 g.83416  ORF g.83416 m.83416 type:complete len:982 (+) comp36345_c0_seq6:123-3068(+)